MTAESAADYSWAPDPLKQRRAGYTLEDMTHLPDDVPRAELYEGIISLVPTPTGGHQKINWRLVAWLERNLPVGFEPQFAVGVAIGVRDTLEPDALVLRSPVELSHHYYTPDQVVVAVEIVSPGTRRRDRMEKPLLYARAGIAHYWRIEQDPVRVHAYDLVNGAYELAAESETELVLSAPFPIKLPIREITP